MNKTTQSDSLKVSSSPPALSIPASMYSCAVDRLKNSSEVRALAQVTCPERGVLGSSWSPSPPYKMTPNPGQWAWVQSCGQGSPPASSVLLWKLFTLYLTCLPASRILTVCTIFHTEWPLWYIPLSILLSCLNTQLTSSHCNLSPDRQSF